MLTITTQDIGIKDFLHITTGFKMEQIKVHKKQGEGLLKNVYQSVDDKKHWGAAGVFVSVATKTPKEEK